MKALDKDIVRSIKRSGMRFFYVCAIIALGIGFFCGIKATAPSMERTAGDYFYDQKLSDFRLLSTYGFREKDITALSRVPGVARVEGGYTIDVMVETGSKKEAFKLISLPGADGQNQPRLTEGRLPEKIDECLLETAHGVSHDYGVHVGDTITVLEDASGQLEHLKTRVFTVVGFAEDPQYISMERGNTTIGDGSLSGYALVPPQAFDYARYTNAYVLSTASQDGISAFTDLYTADMKTLKSTLDQAGRESLKDNDAEIAAEGGKQIEKAQKELDDGRAELTRQVAEAEEKLAVGEQELDDGRAQLEASESELRTQTAAAEEKLAAGEAELSAQQQKLDVGRAELETSRARLEASQNELTAGEAQLSAGEARLEDARAQYEAGRSAYEREAAAVAPQLEAARAALKTLEDGLAQVDSALSDVQDKQTALEDGIAQTERGVAEAQAGLAQITDGIERAQAALTEVENALAADPDNAELAAKKQALDQQILALEEKRSQTEQTIEALTEQQAALEASRPELEQTKESLTAKRAALSGQLSAVKTQLAEGEEKLAAAKAQLDAAKAQIDTGTAELEASRQKLETGKAQLASGQAQITDAQARLDAGAAQLDAGREQLAAGRAELTQKRAEGEAELSAAREKLAVGEQELAEGRAELERQRADGEQKLAEAQVKIDDAREKLRTREYGTWYTYGRADNPGYTGYEEDCERIGKVANVFPLFFLLVAALVAFTTMTRMVEEERTQIGTLYALGYTPAQILKKYVIYAGLAALIGATVGWIVGVSTLPRLIYQGYSILYELPPLTLVIPWGVILLSYGVALACTVGAAAGIAGSTLRAVPAELMRPKAPKPGKRILLERITPLWKRMRFLDKICARNIFRYKARFFMTVIGIAGCTALILAGFGLHDAIFTIVPRQFGDVFVYDQSLVIKDSKSDIDALTAQVLADSRVAGALAVDQQTVTVKTNNGPVSAYLIVPRDPKAFEQFIRLHPRVNPNEKIALSDSGAVVNEKLADAFGAAPGTDITLESDGAQWMVPVSAQCENYMYNYIYMTPELYRKVSGKEPEYTMMMIDFSPIAQDEAVQQAFAADMIAGGSFQSALNVKTLKESAEKTMNSLNFIVIVMVICAGLLAFIVLYNLTNINISERAREIATLKVLGFRQGETDRYIFRENLVLAVIGAALGVGLGVLLTRFILYTVELDIIMFGRDIKPLSYVYAVALTLGFTLIVNLTMIPIIKKINMVEALKNIE